MGRTLLNAFIRYIYFAGGIFLSSVRCFNIDTDLSSVINGPVNSYFGFSLDILTDDLQQQHRLIVGAPVGNSSYSPDIISPGNVYICGYNNLSQCQELDFNITENDKAFQHHGQLFGFSLSVLPGNPSRITACAPLLKLLLVKQPFYFLTGRCSEMTYGSSPLSTHVFKPLGKFGRKKFDRLQSPDGTFMKAVAQGGFSVHYTQTRAGQNSLILGGPGYNDYRGGIGVIENDRDSVRASALDETFPNASYAGYSLASGIFFSDRKTYIVAGSPGYNGFGEVFVLEENFQRIRLRHSGEQFGSYYGASVCVLDTNNDSFDDLVVGAPFYSFDAEEGKVYVYKSDSLQFLEEAGSLMGPRQAFGRFGSAMQNLGDLNADGYHDLAIGAPFIEDSGAIYIYLGSKLGLSTLPSQTILGKSIAPNLHGFGWAFSRPVDTDKNEYPDFAVGSVFSDQVVTIRTRPVATITASLVLRDDVVNFNDRCFYQTWYLVCTEVMVSFHYTGRHCPEEYDISFELIADPLADEEIELGRAQFLVNDALTPTIHRTLTLKKDRSTRVTFTIIIQARSDTYTDLTFAMSFVDRYVCTMGKASCPILNPNLPSTFHEQLPFPKLCGEDEECVSNLILDMFTPRHSVIGSPSITVKIVVENQGEPAYLARVKISFNKYILVSEVMVIETPSETDSVYCDPREQEEDENIINCVVGNPIPANSTVSFLVTFDTSGIRTENKSIIFSAEAVTKSLELNWTLADNSVTKQVALTRDFRLMVYSQSLPEQVTARRGQKDISDDHGLELPLRHQYKIVNIGIGSAPLITVTLDVPVTTIQGKHIFNISSVQAHPDIGQREDVDTVCIYSDQDKLRRPQATRDSIMSCLSTHCARIVCKVKGLKRGLAVLISIDGFLQESTFSGYKRDNVVQFESTASFEYEGVSDARKMLMYKVKTDVFGHIRSPIGWWVWVVSLLGGLILAVIIVVVLWKFGFFRRRRRDDIRRLLSDHDTDDGSGSEMRSLTSPEPAALDSPTDLPPPVEPCMATCGADYLVPLPSTDNPRDYKDDYLHPISVALPPERATKNKYEDFELLGAYKGTRL